MVAGPQVPVRASRRHVVGSLLGLCVAPLVTTDAVNARMAEATPAVGAFPRTVTHASGETLIPSAPRRIVVTNENEALDSMLALGLEPVLYAMGGGYGEGLAPWAVAAGADKIPSYVAADIFVPDPERIAAANPDLILGTWLEPDSFEILSGIAPTINLKYDEATTWDEVQRLAGQATGRDAGSEAVIAATNDILGKAREDLAPLAGSSIAVGYAWSDSFLVNGENAPLGRLLRDFGLTVISPETEPPGGIAMLSLEQMQQVADAELLLSLEFVLPLSRRRRPALSSRRCRRCRTASTWPFRRRWRKRFTWSLRSACSGRRRNWLQRCNRLRRGMVHA